jgi:hypothetical protein
LKGFTTTENDMKKKKPSKFPIDQFRNKEVDLVPEDPSEDTRESMTGDGLNLENGKKRRDEQFKATKDLSENPEEEGQDEVE